MWLFMAISILKSIEKCIRSIILVRNYLWGNIPVLGEQWSYGFLKTKIIQWTCIILKSIICINSEFPENIIAVRENCLCFQKEFSLFFSWNFLFLWLVYLNDHSRMIFIQVFDHFISETFFTLFTLFGQYFFSHRLWYFIENNIVKM